MFLLWFSLVICVASSTSRASRGKARPPKRKQWKDWESSDFVTFSSLPVLNATAGSGSGGVSVFDCNNDGFDDILLSQTSTNYYRLYINTGSGGFEFEEKGEEAGLRRPVTSSGFQWGTLAVDIDNDGWVDAIVSGVDFIIQVFRNKGNCIFEDVSETMVPYSIQSEQRTAPWHSTGGGGALAASDYDHDGDLDIVVTSVGNLVSTNYVNSGSLIIFQNNLNTHGVFSPIFWAPFIPHSAPWACIVAFEDVDEDGWDDLILGQCNDVGPGPMSVWINRPYFDVDPHVANRTAFENQRIFVDQSAQLGLGYGGPVGYPMSVALGDINCDNHVDILVTSLGTDTNTGAVFFTQTVTFTVGGPALSDSLSILRNPHMLLESKWDKRGNFAGYSDELSDYGISPAYFSWGADLIDFDNDGWDDAVVQGNILPNGGNPGVVYKNVPRPKRKKKRFFEARQELGLAQKTSLALAVGDFNQDGFVDFVVSTLDSDAAELFRNNGIEECRDCTRTYLDVSLRGNVPVTNYFGVGSKIEVFVSQIKYHRVGKIGAGENFLSSNALRAHFGIPFCGALEELATSAKAKVTVTWMGSGRVQEFVDVALGQNVVLQEST